MPRPTGLTIALFAALVGTTTAQTERDLERAVERYEKAVAAAERDLLANLDRAAAKAKDKATLARIAHETERFERLKEVPGCVPTGGYVRARDAAITALAAQYEPVVRARRAAKQTDAADTIEGEYAKLVKKARGFGLAVPDPSKEPLVVIRSRDGADALEPLDPRRDGSQVAVAKYVRGRLSQVWRLERGEDGIAFRTVTGGLYLHVPAGSQTEGERLVLWRPGETPPNKHYSWQADERLRQVVLASSFNGLVLTAREITENGQVKVLLTQEKKKDADAQIWRIEVQK